MAASDLDSLRTSRADMAAFGPLIDATVLDPAPMSPDAPLYVLVDGRREQVEGDHPSLIEGDIVWFARSVRGTAVYVNSTPIP